MSKTINVSNLYEVQQWFKEYGFTNLDIQQEGLLKLTKGNYELTDNMIAVWTNHPNVGCGFICEVFPEEDVVVVTCIYDNTVYGYMHLIRNTIELENYVNRCIRNYSLVFEQPVST